MYCFNIIYRLQILQILISGRQDVIPYVALLHSLSEFNRASSDSYYFFVSSSANQIPSDFMRHAN